MKRLGQLLLERGWINRGVLDRALAAQSAIGGRLGTCLLDSGALSEQQLLEALSLQHGVEAADADELRTVRQEVYGLIPDRLAARRGAVPIRKLGSALEVAMADPGDLALRDEIAFAAGKRVVPRVALEVRLAEALERFYGVATSDRLNRLIERLNRSRYLWSQPAAAERPAPNRKGIDELFPPAPALDEPLLPDIGLDELPAAAPSGRRRRPPPAAAAPRPASPAAVREPARTAPPTPPPASQPAASQTAARQPVARPAAARPTAASPAADTNGAEPRRRPDPGPPLEIEGAGPETIAAAAGDRDAVGRAILAALRVHFDRAAVFAARADGVKGWMGSGAGLDPERLAAFRVSFRQPSVFLNLRHGSSLHLGPLPPMPPHRELASCFHDQPPFSCFLLPVTIRGRLAAVLYGDRDGGSLGGLDLAEMRRLGAAAAGALERCIVLKKQSEA